MNPCKLIAVRSSRDREDFHHPLALKWCIADNSTSMAETRHPLSAATVGHAALESTAPEASQAAAHA
jgi:hypothetical protein